MKKDANAHLFMASIAIMIPLECPFEREMDIAEPENCKRHEVVTPYKCERCKSSWCGKCLSSTCMMCPNASCEHQFIVTCFFCNKRPLEVVVCKSCQATYCFAGRDSCLIALDNRACLACGCAEYYGCAVSDYCQSIVDSSASDEPVSVIDVLV